MLNPGFDRIEQYRDVESINYYHILKEQGIDEEQILEILRSKSRDNSRTPMQWDSSENAGFTSGEPWIPVGRSSKEINAENALKDEDSVFYFYQKLIALRKQHEIIAEGDFRMILEDHNQVMGYTRSHGNQLLIALNNFYGKETVVELPEDVIAKVNDSEVLIANYKDHPKLNKEIVLRPYESIVYLA